MPSPFTQRCSAIHQSTCTGKTCWPMPLEEAAWLSILSLTFLGAFMMNADRRKLWLEWYVRVGLPALDADNPKGPSFCMPIYSQGRIATLD